MSEALALKLDNNGSLHVAIVGGSVRAASIVRLLSDADDLSVIAVVDPEGSSPAMRLARELGIHTTSDYSELCSMPSLDLVIDMSEDPRVGAQLERAKPTGIEIIGDRASEMVWDLLVAKKRGEEQERLYVELQAAYDKIRSHERRLQSSKEALERANEELEQRLAEIFFTHEFFKALTSFSSVDDVTSLIVDGCNGILGAEISCVYLLDPDDWALTLRASQGRPVDAFVAKVPVTHTIIGEAFYGEVVEEADVSCADASLGWARECAGIRSQTAIPLRAGESLVGVLVVASSSPRVLTRPEMDRLLVIGNQSSVVLQNALLHEELERLSVTDRLTELYNHGYLQQRLEEEVHRAARFGHPLSLVMLDIDDFKVFNDTYGHPKGDTVLQAVSGVIRQNLREMDVAARYGGEEFVVVLPETSLPGALAVADRIRRGVEAFSFAGADGLPPIHKTVSIGVAAYPQHAITHGKLIEMADAAMYRAKRAGKNTIEVAGRG